MYYPLVGLEVSTYVLHTVHEDVGTQDGETGHNNLTPLLYNTTAVFSFHYCSNRCRNARLPGIHVYEGTYHNSLDPLILYIDSDSFIPPRLCYSSDVRDRRIRNTTYM